MELHCGRAPREPLEPLKTDAWLRSRCWKYSVSVPQSQLLIDSSWRADRKRAGQSLASFWPTPLGGREGGREGEREGGREGERRGSGVCVCVFVVCVCRVCVRVCLLPLVLMLLLSLTTLSTLPTLSRTHLCTAVLGVDNASYVAWACNRAFSSFSLALVLLPLFFLGGSV